MTNTCRILLVSLSLVSLVEALVSPIFFPTRSTSEAQSLPALNMAIRNRGLEVRRDGATPQGAREALLYFLFLMMNTSESIACERSCTFRFAHTVLYIDRT
jgi:type II secretory pathway pseudopilin PulG